MWAAEAPFSRSGSWREAEDEADALRWAALQRLPTVARARRGLLRSPTPSEGVGAAEGDDVLCEVDVAGLSSGDRTALVDRLLADSGDAEHFFRRIRSRFDAVNIEFPKIEVRYEDLTVDAYVHVGSRALPTIPNFICNMTEAFLRHLRIYRGGRVKLPILDNISGIIRPSRMTLLLGPPSSGKTTLLLALAGRLGPGLKRTSAYVSQQDWHTSEMTVRETLEFAGRCQGVGIKYDMLVELLRREKNAGIKPDEDLDVFMKVGYVSRALCIQKNNWLDICADTIVGDEMIKGISGGQKKRLTTGELLVGDARVLFMDEISTGLDSATTYQIIKYLRHSTHALDGTTIISLLQPAPETYELFDDVILIAEGQIVYQGPREYAVDFFAAMGFRCPERKNVLSKKDQQQYWCHYDYPYQFVSVSKFAEAFKTFIIGKRLHEELAVPYNRHRNHPAALSKSSYGVKRMELLKTNFQWQRLLMKRNSFIYVFKFIQQFANQNITLGEVVLTGYGLFKEKYWFWIGVGALFGYAIVLNILFTLFLTLLNPIGTLQAVVSKDEVRHRDSRRKNDRVALELRSYLHSNSLNGLNLKEQKGMVLPFQPLSMCFRNINYYVDVPEELKRQGIAEDRLQLLVDVTGAFRPGILTALVGVSGAGKTTLMDVLAGRKTGGLIEGSITISGYPKNQETFTRISGYCEQNDVHSPCLTVIESLLYSACLRLPSHVDADTQRAFVEEVMELVELNPLSGALVGLPGVNGLSTEQRKRLTIAVELVANPSIVFMDEPTSGLDARSAAIVMRTVRNIVNTGRTIVCTIHQPSIDIFESFDELLFMKRGGQLIYAGPLGSKSRNLVEFFEAIPGLPKIRDGYNPAAWMLEVTSSQMEHILGVDFADYYRQSKLFQQTKEIVEALSKLNNESKELTFATKYAQPFCAQYTACLWKQNLSKLITTLLPATSRETQHDIFNAMGAMYAAVLFIGITNATSVQPVISIERSVSYRERAAGMYSALPFAFSLVTVEFPYILVQSLIYGTIFYSLGSFEWTAAKFLWFLFFMYFTLLYFTFYGMMTTAITPNHTVAPIIAAPFYTLWNLFSGFMIPRKRIPVWWRWYYWANPVSWTLYGLLTSQFGDLDRPLLLADGVSSTTVVDFLEQHFGFRYDFLGVVAAMVAGFCVLFALVFALAIKSLNFQRR
ncbi:hypothetical protein PR202_ga23283 [Eleusine coracana subsp. coracana]|uniref:ABC transporter domain-containing protein n=1 Tax=Eleusine coracana subsp. coracana TaxID=191504 RepID=A0AAV5D597_ELECO|nr:hypothetical protein PR202_ga23283 [Eleusine coracana subsp. coracana]